MWGHYIPTIFKKYINFCISFITQTSFLKIAKLFIKKIIRFSIIILWSLIILKTYFYFFDTFYMLKFEFFFNLIPLIQFFFYIILTIYFRHTLSLLIDNTANFMAFGTLKFFYTILFFKNLGLKVFLQKMFNLLLLKIKLIYDNYWKFRQLLSNPSTHKTKKMKFLKKIILMLKKKANNEITKLMLNSIKTFFTLLDVTCLFIYFFFNINENVKWKPHNIRLPYFKKILNRMGDKSKLKNIKIKKIKKKLKYHNIKYYFFKNGWSSYFSKFKKKN